MKKILALLLLLALCLPVFSHAEEAPVIIDKIADPENTFAFDEDAQLLEIYIPNIYDNHGMFIRCGEYTMLLDTAGDMWRETQSMLRELGVTELDYAFVSHPHTDHIKGMHCLLEEFPADVYLHAFPEETRFNEESAVVVQTQLRAMGVPFHQVYNGDTIEFGDVEMTVFQHWETDFSTNDNSAMLMIKYGERSFLFTADVHVYAQRLFVEQQAPLQADIITFPHHGYNGMQYAFLTMIDPKLVVVTSGSWSAGGVPYLEKYGYPYYYTNMGGLRFTTDGTVWVVERLN